MTGAYVDTARRLAAARQELLNAAAPRARPPEAVGGQAAQDIENLLVTVRVMLDLAAEGSRSSCARLRLGGVMFEVTRLEDILRDSLGFSRPWVEPRREEVDVQRLLLQTSAEVETRARARDVVVSTEGPPLLANVDPHRLGEALFNVMANAVGACAHGAVVGVQAIREADGVSILIRDGGDDTSPRVRARAGTPSFTMQEQAS
ncbi:HAMP domain-containing histidine kinase [Myxococcaceae bacterium JPH2]|nr:HAMP domain-containing histidine kinase [Myxococcaceae bacterium JPH2]